MTEPEPQDAATDLNRGIEQLQAGDYEEALASFDRAIAIEPENHKAWFYRSHALRNLERYQEAIPSYDKFLEAEPENYEAWYYRGNSLFALEQYQEAVASYDKALEIQPDYYQARENRSMAEQRLGKAQAENPSTEKGLPPKPIDPRLLETISYAPPPLPNIDGSSSWLENIDIGADPERHQFFLDEALRLYRAGNYREALANWDKALQINPNDHTTWFNRGVVLRKFLLLVRIGALR